MSSTDEVDFDLSRLTELATEISKLSDSISANLGRIDKALGQLGSQVGEEATVELSEEDRSQLNHYALEISRARGKWGLSLLGWSSENDESAAYDLLSAPLRTRLVAARYIPELLEKYLSAALKRLDDIKGPADQIERLARQLDSAVGSINSEKLVKIRMTSMAAGPDGSFPAGSLRIMPQTQAQPLLDGRYAVLVEEVATGNEPMKKGGGSERRKVNLRRSIQTSSPQTKEDSGS